MRFLILPAMLLAGPAFADEVYPHHMMDYGYGVGFMFGPILWLIILGLIVAGVVWFARRTDQPNGSPASSARAELDLRFARGEIDAEDYTARKKLLAD